jgi:peptidylprolyl isomerase
MAQAKKGDSVKIHYTGRLEDGTVFDTSRERDPLEFTLGTGMVIPGFDEAVEGMAVGDEKTAEVPSEEAYGPRRDDLMISVPPDQFPDDLDPEVGQQLQMQTGDGQTFVASVAQVEDDAVVLDANHPLAGKDLTFDIELVEIG